MGTCLLFCLGCRVFSRRRVGRELSTVRRQRSEQRGRGVLPLSVDLFWKYRLDFQAHERTWRSRMSACACSRLVLLGGGGDPLTRRFPLLEVEVRLPTTSDRPPGLHVCVRAGACALAGPGASE